MSHHAEDGNIGPGGVEEFDFYEIFELGPNARIDTIHSVYRLLARRYHPDNPDTGDENAFRRLVEAYRVLSDPEDRAAYDVKWHSKQKLQWKIFDQSDASTKVALEKRKRKGILTLLYTKRVNAPDQPALTLAEMADLLGCAREHLEVSLWYLKKRGWVEGADNGRFAITVDGFDEAETHGTWQVPKDRLLTDGNLTASDPIPDPVSNPVPDLAPEPPEPAPSASPPPRETLDELSDILARYRT